MENRTTKIIGPPGTGKTTTLIGIVQQALDSGIHPDKIGYISFTRKAADEAKNRARDKFNLTDNDLPYFRTIHSLAFRQLGLSTSNMVDHDDYQYLGEILGLEIKGSFQNYADGFYESPVGDKIVFIESVARSTGKSLKETWEDYDNEAVSFEELERYAKTFEQYKQNKMMFDYTDILYEFIKHGHVPQLDLLIVDEAQDLSPIQWEVVNVIAKNAGRIYYGGDDDQCIYRWAGADVRRFIESPGDLQVLSVSHRLPASIKEYSEAISARIGLRIPKVYNARDEGGSVEYIVDIEELDLSSGTWYLLGRNNYLLGAFEDLCIREGVSFENARGWSPTRSDVLKAIRTWTRLSRGQQILGSDFEYIKAYRTGMSDVKLFEDQEYTIEMIPGIQEMKGVIWHEALDKISYRLREYFIAALRRGENLNQEPRIKISTIHGVKGGEADNVVLLPDMSKQTYNTMLANEDDEHRVFYVGATRARKNLYLMMPKSNFCYDL